MIEVIYETNDPKRREVVDRYFEMDDRGRFSEDVMEIGADHGITWKQVVSVARSCSTVLSTVYRCEVCGNQKEFATRQDIRETRTMDTYLCSEDCRKKKRQRKEKKRSEADEEKPPGSAGDAVEQLLRKRVGRVSKALSGVTEQLSTISNELQEIKSVLRREYRTGQKRSGEAF